MPSCRRFLLWGSFSRSGTLSIRTSGLRFRLLARVETKTYFTSFVGKDFPEQIGMKGTTAASTPSTNRLGTIRCSIPRPGLDKGAWDNVVKDPKHGLAALLGQRLHDSYGWELRNIESRGGRRDVFYQGQCVFGCQGGAGA